MESAHDPGPNGVPDDRVIRIGSLDRPFFRLSRKNLFKSDDAVEEGGRG